MNENKTLKIFLILLLFLNMSLQVISLLREKSQKELQQQIMTTTIDKVMEMVKKHPEQFCK